MDGFEVIENAYKGDITLVILGMSGSGKSRTANTILAENAFPFGSQEAHLVTQEKSIQHFRSYREITVMEPPGYNGLDDITEELQYIHLKLKTVKHVFVICIEMNRYTEEYKDMLRVYEDAFGRVMYSSSIVVFTHYDTWRYDMEDRGNTCVTSEGYMKNLHPTLNGLVWLCSNRYCFFNNRASDLERDEQSKQFFTYIEKINYDSLNYVISHFRPPFTELCRLIFMLLRRYNFH